MSSNFKNFNLDIFGESHAEKIGVIIKGFPKGLSVNSDGLKQFLSRRRASKGIFSTNRLEEDLVIFEAGIIDELTNGDDIRAVIHNKDLIKEAYSNLASIPRPSHSDYVAYIKSNGKEIASGGGRFSGRMTAPLCIAGYIAKKFLQEKGIEVLSYVSEIGGIEADSYKKRDVSKDEILSVEGMSLPVINEKAKNQIEQSIKEAREDKDSLGGVIECIVFGMPAGIGETLYDGLEGRISKSIFAVPAVKGIEFGDGFSLTSLRGSKANDPIQYVDNKVATTTNRSGGINGGISNGMPITIRVAIRPTPSIGKKQVSVNLKTRENVEIEISGRHDACIVPRAVPCIESAVALAIMDAYLDEQKQ